jgi:class 3 adenylate cyclase
VGQKPAISRTTARKISPRADEVFLDYSQLMYHDSTTNVETRHVRYIFADVVRFTENRTLEAQVEIVAALNDSFKKSIGSFETIYLPTGDGMCAGILDVNVPADIHLQVATKVLESFHTWCSAAPYNRHAELRIAINESVDAVVTDINGNRNLAGTGINSAQRLMSIANGNQIILGRAAYETLRSRDKYADAFRQVKAEIKHGHILSAYQFTGFSAPFLDTEMPWAVQRLHPIDLEMTEEMEKPGGYSTAGMVRATHAATEKWEAEIEDLFPKLAAKCNDEQRGALNVSQAVWKQFYEAEQEFLGALRQTVHGTMYRPMTADIFRTHARERAMALRSYLDDWLVER